jgi:uncharacterized protein (TIGR02246 family)
MIRFAAAALAATAMTAGLAASPAQAQRRAACQPVTPAQVEAQFARFNAAWATRNPDTVTALFARDAVLLPTVSNTPRTNSAGIRDYFVSFLKAAPVGRIDSSTVRIGCNMATRVGTWTVSLTGADGRRSDVRARYSFVYAYQGGQWRIAHLHSSMMPEPLVQTSAK